MKSKLDKRSYLIGILVGISIGVSGGYMLAISQGLHRIGTGDDGEVIVSIATLKKLEKNDIASASRLLQHVIAGNYLKHSSMVNNWWMRVMCRSADLIDRVDVASKELPSLKQTIEEERTRSATSKAEQVIPPHDR